MLIRASDGLVMENDRLLDGANYRQCLIYHGTKKAGEYDVILPILITLGRIKTRASRLHW